MAVESLFGMSPEDIQAQRQAAAQQQAMQYAKMSPAEAVNYGGYMAGNQLGNALIGMLGTKDPVIERAALANKLAQETDFNDLDSVKALVSKLNKVGATREAMSLLPRIDKLTEAAAGKASKLEEAKAKKGDFVQSLIKEAKYKPASISKFLESGDISDLETLDGKKTERKTSWQTIDGKRKLVDDQTGEVISVGGAAGKSLEEALGTGLGQLGAFLGKKQAEAAGAEAGKEVGKQTALVQGKYDALDAITQAKKLLKSGIYAGGYGPLQEGASKYAGLGDKERLVNTEEYRATIGNVVIPRLQEFGGNDSVEELKYLKSVMAGETTMEAKAMERVLQKAEKKIQAGIKRLQQQGGEVQSGQLPSTGPVSPPPKAATMRFDPATGKLVKVQ